MPIVPVYTSTMVGGVAVPATAQAVLTSTNMTGGTGPSGAIRPPGFVSGGCPTHHQRGHLIGNKLGGSGTDPNNLVTLTEGTNHPIMYEFEALVYAHVTANAGTNFTYRVTACYNAAKYLAAPAAPGGAPNGAAGNPYCPPPCPESLQIDFFYIHAGTGLPVYPIAIPALAAAPGGKALLILNGVYKFHEGSARHVANGCWAS